MAAAGQQDVDAIWQGGAPLPDMDDRQFAQWTALVEERTGMAMPAERKSFLITSVGLRMRELGFRDYDAYYRYLTEGVAGRLEWTELVDRLTVHETRFFRDTGAIAYLRDGVLPRVAGAGSLNVWSVGCSTGEEVYTLAMVLDSELSRVAPDCRVGITGTDVSLRALQTARQALYPKRRLRDIPEDLRLRYCEPLPGQDRFSVVSGLCRRVCFAHMNVLDVDRTPPLQMDVIFCQNLLIYFDMSRRQSIVEGLARHLRPEGELVLGSGEFVRDPPEGLVRVRGAGNVLAFRRRM